MKDIIFKVMWVILALLFIGKLGRISKEIHFLGVETRRVAFAINSYNALTMEEFSRSWAEEHLRNAGFADKDIEDYFKKQK